MTAAILLDFDGLLCDTEHAGYRAWQELYAAHGLTFPPAVWRSMIGRPDGERTAAADLARRLGGGTPSLARLLAQRGRKKRELCAREPLRPGATALLDAAERAAIPAVVVSSSPRDWVAGHLGRLGVLERFAFLATGDLTGRHKPHPDLYELALNRLGLALGEVLAFEDSPVGIRAAHAAGVRCVAVPNAVIEPADLADADLVLPSLADFARAGAVLGPEVTPDHGPTRTATEGRPI